jgi:hypothetical protein
VLAMIFFERVLVAVVLLTLLGGAIRVVAVIFLNGFWSLDHQL